jgi:hypothetical protein
MPTSVEKFASAGTDITFWARNSSGGYPMGATGTLANAAESGMLQLYGVQTQNLTVQQPRRVNVTGDDGVVAQFIFQPEELPGGDLVVGVFDADLVAQSQGIKVYTDGDWSVTGLQPEAPVYSDLTLIVNSQAKSKDSGSSGSGGYMVTIYPKVNIVPLGPTGLTSAGPTAFSHALIANKSDKLPWGTSFSTSNNGTTQMAVYGPFFSENRVTIHTHISDGSETTFTLDKTPVAANGNKVKVYRNGTLLTYTTDYTVDVGTRVVTLDAAGTAADVHTCRYEYTQ